jgi:hypothetical protein
VWYVRNEGNNNIAIGYQTGDNWLNGEENILIGNDIDFQDPMVDDQLSIGNLIFATGGFGTGTTVGTGNIGIGVAAPQNKLDIEGAAVIGVTYSGTNTAPTNGLLVQGNVGIGTTSPSQVLDVNGNARIRSIGSGAYTAPVNQMADGTFTTATSDRRMKKDIETIDNALLKVMQMRGVTFNWREGNDRRMTGMIAQEVKAVMPELVFQNVNDGYYGINYGETSGLLIEATKEQQTLIDINLENIQSISGQLTDLDLEDQITVIGTKLDELEGRTENLEQLTLTVDNLNNLTTTITDTLLQHEERITQLEDAITNWQLPNQEGSTELTLELVMLANNLTTEELEDGSYLFALDGSLKVERLEAETVVAGEVVLKEEKSYGKAKIKEGKKKVKISNDNVVKDSLINVTPVGTPMEGINWTVDNIREGEFEIKLSSTTSNEMEFNWWVMGTND